ncbi:MAG: hypothetical protein JST68_24025 [Bacteroidetes bacterium]|nr:hypothetical protein [Bacteroidota bacterium]
MPYFTLHRTLAVISLSILLLLAADTFLLPPSHTRQIFDYRYFVESRGTYRSHTHYTSDFIKTKSGEDFQIPANLEKANLNLKEGDTFYLDKSLLHLLPWQVIKNNKWNERVIFFSCAVTALLIFYYFYH